MQSIFFEVGFIVVLATILGGFVKYLRQPLVLAYIFTGVLVKILGFSDVGSPETLSFFSHLGIAFLLFIVGLELDPDELKEMGKKSLFLGIGQIVITFGLSFLLCLLLQFNLISSFFIAISLTFSSTIIVVKLLIEKNDLTSVYGRIAIAILLLQDLVAVLVLVFLSGLTGEGISFWTFFLTIIKAGIFFTIVYLFSKEVLGYLFKLLSSSSELLFLGGIAWCLLLAAFANFAGFSLEIGAFLAGISLASTKYNLEIGTKIKPLRDFFITIFFVVLGLNISFGSFFEVLPMVIIFTIFVLLIKPIIIIAVSGFLGYKNRISFLTGNCLSQISEFSLIVAAMGLQMGQINEKVSSIITFVGVFTILFSTYLVTYDDKIYKKLKKYLVIFERKNANGSYKFSKEKVYEDHIILIGCHRMGQDFISIFEKLKIPFIVLDFDPKVIKQLSMMGVDCIFGDIGDPEILEALNLGKTKMVISTVPNFADNRAVLEEVKRINKEVIVFLTGSQIDEAFELYKLGADYVILPQLLGGHFVSTQLEKHWGKLEDLKKLKENHMADLIKRKSMGQY